MEKLDLKKQYKHLYAPSAKEPTEVVVPQLSFLAIDGQGNPSEPDGAYMQAIQALYPVAFTIKFSVKKGDLEIDYPVMPLETLWWADDWSAFEAGRRDEWKWRAMIMVPELVTAEMVAGAKEFVTAKKGPVPQLDRLELFTFEEGLAVQLMHIGPYDEEPESVARLHAYIAEKGRAPVGSHHEIYISDPNRTAPERLKTVIRQPMCDVCEG